MDGHVHVQTSFPDPEAAFAHAAALLADPLEVVGDFVLPPAGGPPSRDFQTLHFDFGLPLRPAGPADVARFTALHVPATAEATAATRLAALNDADAAWPADAHARLEAFGTAREGSFARVVEALLADASTLPPLTPAFLCGTEFATLEDELAFLEGLGLRHQEVEVVISPGELLVFDNLAVAHGRRGSRAPGELRQRVYGHRALDPAGQRAVRDRVLAALLAQSVTFSLSPPE